MVAVVLVVWGTTFGTEWIKKRREASRPLPAGDPPNVLLIVLDTVRARPPESLRLPAADKSDTRRDGEARYPF